MDEWLIGGDIFILLKQAAHPALTRAHILYECAHMYNSTHSQCKRFFSIILMYCCTAHVLNYYFRMKLLAFLSISILCRMEQQQFQLLPCPTRSAGTHAEPYRPLCVRFTCMHATYITSFGGIMGAFGALIVYMHTYICHFFLFFGHTSSYSHLNPKRQMGWAHFDPCGHVAGGLGAIRAACRAWQAKPFKLFGLGHGRGKSPGFRNIPGDWVSASPIPVYARKNWIQTGVFC